MENKKLSDEQVLALDKILVEGNEKIVALHFESGYYGRGGSNSAPYTQDLNTDKKLEDLAGQRPLSMFGLEVCAVVNDVVYLAYRGSKTVLSFDAKGRFTDDYEIAYDTYKGCLISPVLKE